MRCLQENTLKCQKEILMKLNKQTLSEQIYQILRSDILSQRIPRGTKLTLKTLTERFDVSTTPVREALTRLSEEQLVSYYSNVGVNVVELTEKDLREIYEFMGDLDSLAITYAAAHADQHELLTSLAEIIASEEGCVDTILRLARPADSQEMSASDYGSDALPGSTAAQEMIDSLIKKFMDVSDGFHLIFYSYCNNSRLTRSAERMRSQMSIAAYQYEKKIDNLIPIHEWHKRICDAYTSGQYEEAASLMKEHMKQSLDYALRL